MAAALDFRPRAYFFRSLTHYSPLIQPSVTRSKWNMDEICGLKFHFLCYVYIQHKNFIDIPPCTKNVIFITEFAILGKILPFYEVREIILRMEEFQKKFSRQLFTNIFRPKMLIKYSILTRYSKVEILIYFVLKLYFYMQELN